jgi:hypothetical protein
MGQSNVWYADTPESASFRQSVWDYITAGRTPASKEPVPKQRRRWQPDFERRKSVERRAIELTVAHYEELGYIVDSVQNENKGWDLDARLGDRLLRLEVKGLSQTELLIELTPNE